ncbi:hypothetical protein Osc7112_4321 [Oscillatoria nigro-viridis PCC 7112]|uniref:Uncharacterized protein n=1 Tax=Phormidium nigroviride PCC 7112 TaxID=179408 RepID=K9VMD5_9CYAN|nr:hypothetical protein Osc7112_4321 [Oscillatoria nigro-viridis PCC 7112]
MHGVRSRDRHLVQESLADEVCKRNCTAQVLTVSGSPYKRCLILYGVPIYKIKLLCAATQPHQNAAGAFSQVYTNNDIFKDFVKLLCKSGYSQQDMA